jgi:hypothetical protein
MKHNGQVFETAGYSVIRQLLPMVIIVLVLKIQFVADRIPVALLAVTDYRFTAD